MKQTTRFSEAGDDGGGGGAAVLSPLQGDVPIDVPTDAAPPEAAVQVPDSPAPTLASQLFKPNGTLADNWEKVMEDNGLAKAMPYFGREGFGGKQDEIIKGLANLVPLSGSKIEEWGKQDMQALTDEQRNTMLGKLLPVPETPEAYNLREMEVFKDQQVSDEFVDYWQKAAHEIKATPEQVQKFFAKNGEWAKQFNEKTAQATAEQTTAAKAEIRDHFVREWGGDYHRNAALVNTWADANLDADNPLHVAMLNDKKGLEMAYQLAKAQDEGRVEGTLPKPPGSAAGGAGTYQQRFDAFITENPGWMGDAALNAEGNRLAKLAHDENQRLRR